MVLGPESTGKTTLVAELAAHYRTAFAPEYLRTLVANQMRDGGRMHVGMRDTRAIVLGQVANEDDAVRRAGEVVIFDTNPLQSLVYYEHYFGARRPLWLERILTQRRYDSICCSKWMCRGWPTRSATGRAFAAACIACFTRRCARGSCRSCASTAPGTSAGSGRSGRSIG